MRERKAAGRFRKGQLLSPGLLLLGIVLGTVLIREYALEGYFIPTASMEPTFMGDPVSGDKVVVDKTRFAWERPRRWMIAVFSREDKPGAYIKRIVGLPGDELRIVNGDLFNHDRILTKPLDLLDDLLIPVYRSGPGFRGFSRVWCQVRGSRLLGREGLHLYADASGELVLQTRDEITDGYVDRNGRFRAGSSCVGDIEVSLGYRADPALGGLEVRIQDGWDLVVVRLQRGSRSCAVVPGRDPVTIPGPGLDSGSDASLTVSNVDDRLVVKVNGRIRMVLRYPSENATRSTPPPGRRNGVEIRLHGDGAVIRRLALRRDLFYTQAGRLATREPIRVAPDRYFVLGDNSENSSDSREWGAIPRRCLIGTPLMILWPPSRFRVF